jgi:hypothetical protein
MPTAPELDLRGGARKTGKLFFVVNSFLLPASANVQHGCCNIRKKNVLF